MANAATAKPRVAVITSGNPRDVATWSGIPFHMLQVLESRFDVVEVVEAPWPWWFHKFGKLLKLAALGRWEYHFSARYTAFAGRRLVAQLKAARPDVVLAISASPMAHLLVDDFRVVNIADATVRSMLGYYDSFTQHMGGDGSAADAIEAKVVSGAFLSLYPSAWARDSALNDYGADPARTQIIKWGSNIAATTTVGVPSAVLSSVTGQLLPLDAGTDAFADAIAAIVASPARYAEMSRAALEDARTRLDWRVWADRVTAAITMQLAIDG